MMDSERRERLAEKRRMALRRLERQRESERFRAVAPLLFARGMKFARVPPVALAAPLMPFNSLPGRDERVYWPEVSGGRCAVWNSAESCAELLRRAFDAVGATRVLLAFHQLEAGLSIAASDLVAAWPDLHGQFYDTLWIVPRTGAGWLVEVSYLDNDLCWLRSSHEKPRRD